MQSSKDTQFIMNMAMTWIVALALTLFGVAQAQQGKLIIVDVRG